MSSVQRTSPQNEEREFYPIGERVAHSKERVWSPGNHSESSASLQGSCRVQVAIVGGGLAGLSTAYYLNQLRPDLDIVLLEAGQIASGASGFSTGMVGPGVGGSIVGVRRRYGDATAKRMFQVTRDAVSNLVNLVQVENLDCDLTVGEQLYVAATPRQLRKLYAQTRCFEDLGFEVPILDRECVAKEIGTDVYAGALRHTKTATLNPVKLCLELRRVLLASGVRIHEHSRVLKLSASDIVELVAETGVVRADQVVIATNGYTASTLDLLPGQVVPLHTHVILSAPLRPSEFERLSWQKNVAVIETRNFFNYCCITPDHRVLLGGGPALYKHEPTNPRAGAVHAVNEKTWQRLDADLRATFPALADIRIDKRWSGTMGFTLDQLPVVGPLDGNRKVFFCGAWSGHGLALSSASARHAASHIVGEERDGDLPWFRGSAPQLPSDPWRAWGLHAYLGLLNTLDWSDQRAASLLRQ